MAPDNGRMGFARFVGDGLKPYGTDANFVQGWMCGMPVYFH